MQTSDRGGHTADKRVMKRPTRLAIRKMQVETAGSMGAPQPGRLVWKAGSAARWRERGETAAPSLLAGVCSDAPTPENNLATPFKARIATRDS